MLFITRNPEKGKLKKIIILPYLHKRKIQLGKNKLGVKYFQTAIEASVNKKSKTKVQQLMCMDVTNHKYCIYSEGGILKDRVSFKKEIEDYGEIISVSNNGRLFLT
jgi:hypothetical protein